MLLTFSAAVSDILIFVPIDSYYCDHADYYNNWRCQTKSGQAMNATADVALSCKLTHEPH